MSVLIWRARFARCRQRPEQCRASARWEINAQPHVIQRGRVTGRGGYFVCYATSKGEGSAREIWRLTEMHAAYRWIRGDVDVGYHTLSDCRSQQGEIVNALITQVLALLLKQNLVDLSRVAQDGTRVRASAGAASFRREPTLQALMAEARAHLEPVTCCRP